MAASEIESADSHPNLPANFLNPIDCVFGLHSIEDAIVLMFQMMGDQFVDYHFARNVATHPKTASLKASRKSGMLDLKSNAASCLRASRPFRPFAAHHLRAISRP